LYFVRCVEQQDTRAGNWYSGPMVIIAPQVALKEWKKEGIEEGDEETRRRGDEEEETRRRRRKKRKKERSEIR
jgi:hypothetical protein